MKKDIENKGDIITLVNKFYTKVINDEIIGHIFKDIAGFTFEKHIPIMVSFWETLLFGVVSYKGNPMIKHIELNKIVPLQSEHFVKWLSLWEATINENFEGSKASEAISRAKNIAGIMQLKIGEVSE